MSYTYENIAEKMRANTDSTNEKRTAETDVKDILDAINARSVDGKNTIEVSCWNPDKCRRVAAKLEALGFNVIMSQSHFGFVTRYFVKVAW